MTTGTTVRLTNPLNPDHPRKGKLGTVVSTKECPVKPGRPQRLLCWVRFPVEGDRWDYHGRFGVVGLPWGVYATELTVVESAAA